MNAVSSVARQCENCVRTVSLIQNYLDQRLCFVALVTKRFAPGEMVPSQV